MQLKPYMEESYNLLAHTLPDYGVTTTFVDADEVENFEKAIQDNTKAIFIETLGNPNSSLIDVDAVAEIAHKHKIPLILIIHLQHHIFSDQ